ncbi:MAG TPA: hypothetical protein VK539_27430 [Myxococcaceae bacterium]|nr:hypothetical protein [Myxococcaceae bacterium]
MSSLRNLLCAATAVGLLFSSTPAEARFGKRSNDSKQEKKKKKTHEATAVGDEDSDGDDDSSSRSSSSSSSRSSGGGGFLTFLQVLSDVAEVADAVSHASDHHYTATTQVAVVAQAPAPAPAPAPAHEAEVSTSTSTNTEASVPFMFRVGMGGAPMGGGSAFDLFLTLEGQRMGLDARGTRLTLPTDDGTAGSDELSVGTLHLTYAMISRERIRLRLEGGLSMATAPDLSVAGPSLALSMEACLVGTLDLELRAQAAAFPYQQLDAQAGLALNLTQLVLRGGWRGLYLNDAGLVDGVVHEDAFSGPYVGLGFSF